MEDLCSLAVQQADQRREDLSGAQHTGGSGLAWSGLGWARSPNFLPWLAALTVVTVWRGVTLPCPARQIFKWPKFASPTWWVLGPCFVISWAPAWLQHLSYHFSFIIFIRTSEPGSRMTQIVDDKVMMPKILHIRLDIICIILKGFLTDVSWLMLVLMMA